MAEHLIQPLPLAPAALQGKMRVGRLETIPGTCCSSLLILPAVTLCWKKLTKHNRRGEERYRASEPPTQLCSGVISVLNHFFKSLEKAGLRAPEEARPQRGIGVNPSTSPGPFLFKFQVGCRKPWAAQNLGVLALGLWLTGGWKAEGLKAANRWVLDGVRGLCRSSHSALEPLRITFTQLKETLLPLAHRINPARRSSHKHLQRDFGFTSGQYFVTTLGLLPLIRVMGCLLTIHLRTSCTQPGPPPELQPSPSLRTKLDKGEVRDQVENNTE